MRVDAGVNLVPSILHTLILSKHRLDHFPPFPTGEIWDAHLQNQTPDLKSSPGPQMAPGTLFAIENSLSLPIHP